MKLIRKKELREDIKKELNGPEKFDLSLELPVGLESNEIVDLVKEFNQIPYDRWGRKGIGLCIFKI